MLAQAEQDMQQNGMVDPIVIDNIKDLAEAEKYCMESEKLGMEADYFENVVEAMQESPMGYDGGMSGYGGMGGGGRSGYGSGQGGGMGGGGGRSGYGGNMGHTDPLSTIREMLADPKMRSMIQNEMMGM